VNVTTRSHSEELALEEALNLSYSRLLDYYYYYYYYYYYADDDEVL